MQRIMAGLAASVLLAIAANAQAQVVQGRLELQWGDPGAAMVPEVRAKAAAINLAPRFRATLVSDRGLRIELDPDQARRAAGDLYALMGRSVAVEFSAAKSGESSPVGMQWRIEAIVPADDIEGQREHPFAGKVDAVPKEVVGFRRWLTLACKFNDIATEQQEIAYFRDQYSEAVGRLGHYWRNVSYNKTNLSGSDAKGWYTLPNPRSYYVTTDSDGEEEADLEALFRDCAQAADADVDYTTIFGINMMFNGDLDGYAWGGSHCADNLDGARRCFPNTWNPPWGFNNLGVLAHEMGHAYGLPHSDNSDGDDDTYDNPWDVMSDSWRNGVQDGVYGTRPKHISVLQRDRLGWIDTAHKVTLLPPAEGDTTVVALDYASIDSAQSANTQMLVLQTPASPDPYKGTFYTVEARRRTAASGASHPYEGALAGDAVIVHLVGNEYRFEAESQDADRPPADVSNNEGSMFRVGEIWVSPDALFYVYVESQTSTGFVLRVGKPRLTGGRLPARTR